MKCSLCVGIIYCALASLGCGSSASGKALLGSYSVMVASMGRTDPDVLTVSPGSNGTLLLTFTQGITTDAVGQDPNGLRATISGSTMLMIATQPVHVDHPLGPLDGNMDGMGTIATDGTVNLTFHFAPTNFTVRDADGGVVPVADGGMGPQIEYDITGSRL
jgi:hypothetical protein